jgi:hypothetical protein
MAWASSWLVEIPKGRPGPSREVGSLPGELGSLFAFPQRATRSCLVQAVEKAECEDRHSLVLHPHEVSGITIGMALLIECPRQCVRRTQQLRSGLRFKAQPRRLRQAIDNLDPELRHVVTPGCAPRCSVPPVSCWRETQRDRELRPVPTLERWYRAGRVAQRWLGLSASDAPLRNPPGFQAPVGCCDGSHAGRSGPGLWLARAPSCAGAVCSRKPQAFRSPHRRNTSSAQQQLTIGYLAAGYVAGDPLQDALGANASFSCAHQGFLDRASRGRANLECRDVLSDLPTLGIHQR